MDRPDIPVHAAAPVNPAMINDLLITNGDMF